jgi:hypothetical protein
MVVKNKQMEALLRDAIKIAKTSNDKERIERFTNTIFNSFNKYDLNEKEIKKAQKILANELGISDNFFDLNTPNLEKRIKDVVGEVKSHKFKGKFKDLNTGKEVEDKKDEVEEPATPNYKSLSAYNRWLKINGIKTSDIKAGNIYAYDYDFRKHYKDVKYYDKSPYCYVYFVDGDDYWGLNLHFLPVKMREEMITYLEGAKTKRGLLQRIKGLFKKNGKVNVKNIKKISKKNYKQFKAVFSATGLIIRHYKKSRNNEVRIIPNEKVLEGSKYIANTYEGVTYSERMSKFIKDFKKASGKK